ncbi:similar to Saccharomyces cerevisiae YLR022C SDO1 Essential protein involved in 60S ribosome maturation [Maudiozyma barnettii]|uniref:Ribosome maturation protein SDO1 n=1 Tax=Maudiozyma barnettii TaxID=61262 RepID=A0A8H2VC58_9SACH|nr:guanine nucleotide exchange factor SDO1 [Kazachstania barnettii]CAB4252522.1 similar to Saccharomyces cerevisiae YLR022C SDO1 Essential protein involved in 60S ribosome maturation [Kazachstania barnettii]CAD1779256.1 similar to Saccharomyces cerevisiae YLR022C SDO1 Essential protein involved in 60S ribosome maturation [Kazachstania barnettii]
MPIQQPSGQIKLTNVSLVRLRKERKRFEVACYQNKVQDYRKGIEKDMDEVLQIHQVFMNVSKGLVASKEDLQKCFGTTNVDDIIQLILQKGEIQLSEKERQIMLNKINNEMLTIISAKCINPKSKKRYPPTMIHKALIELKFSPVVGKPAKLQALEAIKLLITKQLIPIVRAKMKVKVNIKISTENQEPLEKIKKFIVTKENESSTAEAYECTGLIDPVAYRDLVTLCSQIGTLQVLDMAVIDNGN